MPDFNTVWQRSAVAELNWVTLDGPVGLPVVPLSLAETPCVALPYAHLDALDSFTERRVALSVTERGVLGDECVAAVAVGRVDITHDLRGEIFVEQLLEQEIVKHPPTRLRADSLVARRENWWWVPRVLVSMTDPETTRRVPARACPEDALLVRAGTNGPRVDIVTAAEWPGSAGSRVEVFPRDGTLLNGEQESVYVFGHRHSPDFERWEPWYRSGTLAGETLVVNAAQGNPGVLVEPFGLRARLRNHRALARACRSGIATAESRS